MFTEIEGKGRVYVYLGTYFYSKAVENRVHRAKDGSAVAYDEALNEWVSIWPCYYEALAQENQSRPGKVIQKNIWRKVYS